MKAKLIGIAAWAVIAHCWWSGALCLGIAAEWWGASDAVSGLVVGAGLFALPIILLLDIKWDTSKEDGK